MSNTFLAPFRRSALILATAALLGACGASTTTAPVAAVPSPIAARAYDAEQRTARHLEDIRDTPSQLAAFLRRMPKGGDLHNHLAGAIYAESYIAWAAADGLCVERSQLKLTPPPCTGPQMLPAAEVERDSALYSALVDSLSMRDFVPGKQSGHDHFFETFPKFSPAAKGRGADMLAEVAHRAGEGSIGYLELMYSPGMSAARKIAARVGPDDDLARLRDKLLGAGLGDLVPTAQRELDGMETGMRKQLGCGTQTESPGCRVEMRYLAQVNRGYPAEQVFAQTLLAYELVKADPRFVGLNLVAPEDDPATLRDYTQQMRQVGFLAKDMPQVNVSLHAGELAPGLVPPEDLRFHIRQAVEIAGARRIGHGVDILYEDDPQGLLKEMAERKVLVEINLTSNDQILGITGDRHPFQTYRQYGVPVTLSTDDQGVSRGDLTHEYLRAAQTYHLNYGELKTLARNSIEYAFLSGESLWHTATPFVPREVCATAVWSGTPGPACQAFLAGSEKAQAQWKLETAFNAFETAPMPSGPAMTD